MAHGMGRPRHHGVTEQGVDEVRGGRLRSWRRSRSACSAISNGGQRNHEVTRHPSGRAPGMKQKRAGLLEKIQPLSQTP